MKGWVKIKSAAKYAGMSERTLRTWLKKGLKYSCLPSGTILIRYDDIDDYLESFAVNENEVDSIVEGICSCLRR